MIHPSALISPHARIGSGVSVGAFTIIHPNVCVGDGTEIGTHCEIGHPSPLASGEPLVLGAGCKIRSHSVFYEGSRFGDRLVTGHRVTVREGTKAGTNLQIGTLTDIQGTCLIGDYVRLHSSVFVGQHADIASFVWLFPGVVLTNDPHPPSDVLRGVRIEQYAAVAARAVVLPGLTVGAGALVGAQSLVRTDVEPDTLVAGVPAKRICAASEIRLDDGRPAYPWRRHFRRGYPIEVVEAWLREFGDDRQEAP